MKAAESALQASKKNVLEEPIRSTALYRHDEEHLLRNMAIKHHCRTERMQS
jgi:hypothetical protein